MNLDLMGLNLVESFSKKQPDCHYFKPKPENPFAVFPVYPNRPYFEEYLKQLPTEQKEKFLQTLELALQLSILSKHQLFTGCREAKTPDFMIKVPLNTESPKKKEQVQLKVGNIFRIVKQKKIRSNAPLLRHNKVVFTNGYINDKKKDELVRFVY